MCDLSSWRHRRESTGSTHSGVMNAIGNIQCLGNIVAWDWVAARVTTCAGGNFVDLGGGGDELGRREADVLAYRTISHSSSGVSFTFHDGHRRCVGVMHTSGSGTTGSSEDSMKFIFNPRSRMLL